MHCSKRPWEEASTSKHLTQTTLWLARVTTCQLVKSSEHFRSGCLHIDGLKPPMVGILTTQKSEIVTNWDHDGTPPLGSECEHPHASVTLLYKTAPPVSFGASNLTVQPSRNTVEVKGVIHPTTFLEGLVSLWIRREKWDYRLHIHSKPFADK